MTIQQAFARCIPAIMSNDTTKILEAFADTAKEFLRESGKSPLDIMQAETFQAKVFSLPPARQAMVAAVVEILSRN